MQKALFYLIFVSLLFSMQVIAHEVDTPGEEFCYSWTIINQHDCQWTIKSKSILKVYDNGRSTVIRNSYFSADIDSNGKKILLLDSNPELELQSMGAYYGFAITEGNRQFIYGSRAGNKMQFIYHFSAYNEVKVQTSEELEEFIKALPKEAFVDSIPMDKFKPGKFKELERITRLQMTMSRYRTGNRIDQERQNRLLVTYHIEYVEDVAFVALIDASCSPEVNELLKTPIAKIVKPEVFKR